MNLFPTGPPEPILLPMSMRPDYAQQLAAVISSDEAAELLGVSRARVKVLCQEGRLAAKKCGRDWIVCLAAAQAFAKIARPPGAPQRAGQARQAGRSTKRGAR